MIVSKGFQYGENYMKKMLVVGVAVAMTGCATMTPEQRSERSMRKAMAMPPATLCYAILLLEGTPPEAYRAAELRGIDCSSPVMVELAQAKQQEILVQQAANREAYRNMQNLGTAILQQNQINRPRPLTNCMMVGNTMSCY